MTNEAPERPGFYNFDVWCQLETAIDLYEQDREKYWQSRMEAEEWSALNLLRAEADEIAKLIRERAFALQNAGSQSDLNTIYRAYHERLDEEMRFFAEIETSIRSNDFDGNLDEYLRKLKDALVNPEGMDADDPLHLIWERLCISDAWDTVGSILDRARRVLELERLIHEELGRAKPPQTAISFLSLVSRNYIYGFKPECIVMCRGALDTALRETVTDDHCKRAGQSATRHGFTMAHRIAAAFHNGNRLLAGRSGLYKEAQQVQERGNKVIHYQPDATADVLGTIRSTLRVIDALSELAGSA